MTLMQSNLFLSFSPYYNLSPMFTTSKCLPCTVYTIDKTLYKLFHLLLLTHHHNSDQDSWAHNNLLWPLGGLNAVIVSLKFVYHCLY